MHSQSERASEREGEAASAEWAQNRWYAGNTDNNELSPLARPLAGEVRPQRAVLLEIQPQSPSPPPCLSSFLAAGHEMGEDGECGTDCGVRLSAVGRGWFG